MSVQRYISSSFWSDDWVDSLSVQEKLIYMYLLTNENTTVAGVYKITVKRIKDDTGISREEVVAALDKFAKDKKAFFTDEFIIIPKWPKHQKLGERGKLRLAVNALLRSLPRKIKEFLMQPGHYDYDLSFLGNDNDDQPKPYPENQESASGSENPIPYPENEEKDDTLSGFGGENPIPYPENEEKGDRVCQKTDTLSSDLDLDLDLNMCVINSDEFKTHTGVSPPEEKMCDISEPQKLFLRIWQTTPEKIFNSLARIESPKEWARFWSTSPPTCDEVRLVMQNVIDAVNCGALDVRYIPKTPDRFVLGGGFTRYKERFRQTRQTSPPQSNRRGKKSL
jgi:hypothetical protein